MEQISLSIDNKEKGGENFQVVHSGDNSTRNLIYV